jgi:hypothetical protein
LKVLAGQLNKHVPSGNQTLQLKLPWDFPANHVRLLGFDCNFTLESLGLARDFWYANSWSGKVLPWYSWLVQPASANVSLQPGYWLVVSWKVLGDFSVPVKFRG